MAPDDAEPSPGSPGPPRRRANDLRAERYVAWADVDAGSTGALLERLHDAGIAAYADPLPGAGRDRFYVDADRVGELTGGRDATSPPVSEATHAATPDPQPDPADDEAVWTDLVARLRASGPGPMDSPPTWPDAENLGPDEVPARTGRSGTGLTTRRGLIFLGGVGEEAADRAPSTPPADSAETVDEGDHFDPPPAPPAPRLSRVGRWGVGLIAVGIFLLLAPGVVGLDRDAATLAIAAACIVGGAVALFSRVRNGPSQDDGWDDGAVL